MTHRIATVSLALTLILAAVGVAGQAVRLATSAVWLRFVLKRRDTSTS